VAAGASAAALAAASAAALAATATAAASIEETDAELGRPVELVAETAGTPVDVVRAWIAEGSPPLPCWAAGKVFSPNTP